MVDGVAEYPAKEANCAGGGGFAATNARQSPLFSAFRVAGRLPSATSCMKLSTSPVVTAVTLSRPSRGLIWRSMRPLSISSVLRFFGF